MSYVKYAVPLSGVYAIDETKVRLVRGRYYLEVSTWKQMEGSRAHPNYTLMEYINLTPRFYSRDTLAYALANYVSGLSSWRAVLPHSTLLYYYRRLSYVKYAVPLSGVYVIDETKGGL